MSHAINRLRTWQSANKNSSSRGSGISVDPRVLVEEDGFNVRDYNDPSVIEHINRLKEAYIAGSYVPPLSVQVVDGQVVVREGHCRRRGLILAIEEGYDIKLVRVEEHTGDEIDQSALILTSNDGLKLKALERASVYLRMKKYGLNNNEIAAKVGMTAPHITQYLQMTEMPIKLKIMVKNDKISVTYALELYLENGATKAVEIAESAMNKSTAAGAKKVTKKSVEGKTRISPKVMKEIRSSLVSVASIFEEVIVADDQKEDVTFSMSPELFKLLRQAAIEAKAAAPTENKDNVGEISSVSNGTDESLYGIAS